eukprot:14380732-Alexandrium_andersonii.AAC.1
MAISVLPAPVGAAPCLWNSTRQAQVSLQRPICPAHVARSMRFWIGAVRVHPIQLQKAACVRGVMASRSPGPP